MDIPDVINNKHISGSAHIWTYCSHKSTWHQTSIMSDVSHLSVARQPIYVDTIYGVWGISNCTIPLLAHILYGWMCLMSCHQYQVHIWVLCPYMDIPHIINIKAITGTNQCVYKNAHRHIVVINPYDLIKHWRSMHTVKATTQPHLLGWGRLTLGDLTLKAK